MISSGREIENMDDFLDTLDILEDHPAPVIESEPPDHETDFDYYE